MPGAHWASPVCPTFQGQAPMDTCAGDPSLYYDKAAGRCCFRCPVGEWGCWGWGKGIGEPASPLLC